MADTILSRFNEDRPDTSVIRTDVDYDPISVDSPRETPNSRNLMADPNFLQNVRGGVIDNRNKYSTVISALPNK
jgi:hypothetical protein